MEITVSLFYHLKEKAGVDKIDIDVRDDATIGDLKMYLEEHYPSLRSHLDNVMILMDKQIVLDEDSIKNNAHISFLTPVGGG